MIVAFKRGFKGWLPDGWFALGIMLKTMSIYTHVELQFSDGYCVTASSAINQSKVDGVDIRPLDVSGKEWDRIMLNITDFGYRSEKECRAKAEDLKKYNKGYAWDDIIDHEVLGKKANSKRFYCSEIVAYLLKRKPCSVNPGELYAKLIRMPRTCIA